MAFPQIKRRFSLFSSPPKSPINPPPLIMPQNLNNTSLYFPSQNIRKDNKLTPDDIHKSIENLERLVLAADEYRDCINKLSKISKNFSKCLKDYCNCKEIDISHAQCLQFTTQFYENHAEVQAKLSKALRKEFETLQKFWDKYSKKVAKDEKAHDDYVGDLDKQIKKINKDYEKKSKKENKPASESQEKYITSLTSIKSDIARARTEYAEEVMKREKHTHSVISQIICRLIVGQFASFNDSLKKCGPNITKIKEWTSFAEQDMPSPLDLDSFLEMQNMTLPPENNSNELSNNDESRKPSRRSSYRISQSIASILEMQKAATNNKSRQPLTEEPENINATKDSKSQTSTTSISEKSSDNIFSISVETTTTTVITDVNETKNTAVTEINSPTSSTNVPNSKEKSPSPLTPNLLSSLSIGIHDNDNPFFRDGSSGEIISPDRITTKKSEIEGGEKNNSTKLEESHIVSLTPPPIYNKSRDTIKNSDRRISYQLENKEEINSSNPVPIGNTFRISFVENNRETNENGIRNPADKYNSNEYKEDEYQVMDDKGTTDEKEIRPTPSFETEILVRSFPIDLPVRSSPQTPSNSPKQKSGFYDMRMGNSGKCDSIINNNNDYRETDSLRYDENNGPIHISQDDNKRGPSVADIRERLLSLNVNERRLSTPSTRDFPKPRQGYVNEVKSKFGDASNSRNNNDIPIIPRSAGDRDDIYPDQIDHSEEMNQASPSKSIINERCDCHNCQEIRRAMTMNDMKHHNHPSNDSFLPEDDLTTFGRNNY